MASSSAARNRLSVQFALLVAVIFGGALATLLLVQRTQRQSLAELLASETQERADRIARVVELTSQALQDFTNDYAQWDDMVTFVATPHREWAAINLDASLDNFDLDAAWVLRVDGAVVYATRGEQPTASPPPLPLGETELRPVLATGKAARFFVSTAEGLFEVCLAPVQPSSDTARETQPRGWLVAARLWDAAQLNLVGTVMQCDIALVPPDRALPASRPYEIGLHYPLRGPDGAIAANLLCTQRSPEMAIVARDQRKEIALFAGTFVVAAIAGGYFVFRWIVRPLATIGEALHTGTNDRLSTLLARRDEIGGVARAVKISFEQRSALTAMIEERTRLGRELHDGVIQTVYAAGMSLAGARSLLRQKPADAERILDDTRAELDACVTSLRHFIQGLEPETAPRWVFREAVQSVVALMQGVRPLTATIEIDDDLAASLTGRQRLHFLQIAREAISNSVRHGQAQHIVVRLAHEPAGLVFEIVDDGIGMESAPKLAGGHGLANFAARALELGGELQVTPVPAGGLRIRLVVPDGAPAAPQHSR